MRPLLRFIFTLAAFVLLARWAILVRAQPPAATYLPQVVQRAYPAATPGPAPATQIGRVVCRTPNDAPEDEYITITNMSARPITLTRWTINTSRSQIFTFPAFTIASGPGAYIAVYGGTSAPRPDLGVFFWGNRVPLWQLGDTIWLRDADGQVVDTFTTSVNDCPFRPPPTATATQTQVPASAIRVNDVVCREPTDDPAFEYIELVNNERREINIAGWKIINTSQGNATFTFPNFTIDAGPDVYVVVYGGINTNRPEIGEFYWGNNTQIWHIGDRVELRDTLGRLVISFTVPADNCS